MNNNYWYPYTNYMRGIPFGSYVAPRSTGGILSRLLGGSSISNAAFKTPITFSSILNGASKTLGVINQAIPVINQVKPIWDNAKTMIRVAKIFNEDKPTNNSIKEVKKQEINNIKEEVKSYNYNEGPTFFN